jgi:ComF family protein
MDLSAINQSVLHLMWPQVCAHCREDLPKEALAPLCHLCRPALPPVAGPVCARCVEPVIAGREHCERCAQRLFCCSLIRAAFRYEGAAVSLVHSFKFRGRRDAARTAGEWMGRRLAELPELGRPDGLVPMPLHTRRRRERGYNQAELIALGLSDAANAPVEELLVRRRETRPLWALRREDRLASLSGAIVCPRPEQVAGRRIWVVDDVCTSGASLEACAQALLAAGARSVFGFVFARQARPLLQ